jgi:predicted Fe-Mo cluster-binding NifX family protein
MKIALPIANGQLSMHFGHCEEFVFLEVDPDSKTILNKTVLQPPAHEPGVLPRWLAEQKATVILAGGMGQRAQQLFQHQGIQVVVGAPSLDPETLVQAYLSGTLETGSNACDH